MSLRNANNYKTAKILLLVIVSLILLGICIQLIKGAGDENSDNIHLFRARVQTIQANKEKIELSLPGFLIAYNVTPLLSRSNGYLKAFYHDIGDLVKKDEVLCEIEIPDLEAELSQAKAELKRALARKEITLVTSQRWSGLYNEDSESISKQEVDQTGAEFQVAMADAAAAQAKVDRLQVLEKFKYILAPFDGILVRRNIDVGSLISAGNENMTQFIVNGFETLSQPLFEIANIEILRVFVEVPQPYFRYIEDGVTAEVSVPEFPNRIFTGTVARNAMALNQTSRTLLTQVNIPNKDHALRPGLYSEVKFSFMPIEESFNIPISALIIRNGPPLIATLNQDNVVVLKEVQIGKDYGSSIQVTRGLATGDRIVLNPNYRVQNGVKVAIVRLGDSEKT